jgi:hypothetical protein
MFKKYGGEIIKSDLYEKEQFYKMINQSVAKYRFAMKEKLKYLRNTDPNRYWIIILK